MNEEEFKEAILKRLDMIYRLQALSLIKEKASLKEKIEELSSFGLGPSEIADILKTSPNYVNVALSRIRKTQKKEAEQSDKESDFPDQTKAVSNDG
jgi:orotate phosphoribosyltransferase-like protein